MFCDEGMIYAQKLMDQASSINNDYSEYKRAQKLFRNFYEIKMEYLGRTNVQDEKTARRNATIDTYVEYLSEMVLAKAFDPVGEWLRSTNMYKNMILNNFLVP